MEIKELIKEKILINRKVEELGGFSQEMQILFLVNDGYCTPKSIIEQLGILKTNLSIICKKLINSGYLIKQYSIENKKLVSYSLSVKGKHKLENIIKEMELKYENI